MKEEDAAVEGSYQTSFARLMSSGSGEGGGRFLGMMISDGRSIPPPSLPPSRMQARKAHTTLSLIYDPSIMFRFPRKNKKGILSLICGVCFRLNFDWDVIRL